MVAAMSMRTVTFANDEWYHVCTRGVDKRPIFMDERDAERFIMLLYAGNSTTPIHISNLRKHQGPALVEVLEQKRGEQFVDIGAYSLMGNHLHLAVLQRLENGISSFMQKIGTGYTMYFNKKYERTGTLLSGRFRAQHIGSDQYLRRVINYIHANPAELFEPGWKAGVIGDEGILREKLLQYPFTSLPEYENISRAQSDIINKQSLLSFMEKPPSLDGIFEDARTFYASSDSLED
jgi:putative transposase